VICISRCAEGGYDYACLIVQSFLSITHTVCTLIRCPRSHCHCFGNIITAGSPSLPGLTPKAIDELFRLVQERVHVNVRVTTYFVELYNDNLVDLFWVLDNKGKAGEWRVAACCGATGGCALGICSSDR
jgi:hypothetical protein